MFFSSWSFHSAAKSRHSVRPLTITYTNWSRLRVLYMPETQGRGLEETGHSFGGHYEVPNLERDDTLGKPQMDHVETVKEV